MRKSQTNNLEKANRANGEKDLYPLASPGGDARFPDAEDRDED